MMNDQINLKINAVHNHVIILMEFTPILLYNGLYLLGNEAFCCRQAECLPVYLVLFVMQEL